MSEFNDLPFEVMIIIFQKVDSISQKRLQIVCRKWYSVLKSALFSKEVLLDLALQFSEPDVDYRISEKIISMHEKLITDKVTKIVFILDSKRVSADYGCLLDISMYVAVSYPFDRDDCKYVPKENVKSLVLVNVPITFNPWTRTPNLRFLRKSYDVKLIQCSVNVHHLVHPTITSRILPFYSVHEPTNIEDFAIRRSEFVSTETEVSVEYVVHIMEESLQPLTLQQKNDICAFREAIPGPVKNILPWEAHEYNAIMKYLEENGLDECDLDELPRFIQQLLHRITGKNAEYTIPPGFRISAPDFWTDVDILALAREKLFGHKDTVITIIHSGF